MNETRPVRNVVFYLPKWLSHGPTERSKRLKIIYFITGNPGLIGYYEEFMGLLADSSEHAIVVGASLGGFEVSGWKGKDDIEQSLENDLLLPPGFNKQIYSLQRQISLSWERLLILIKRVRVDYGLDNMPIDVVLVGHSVGAYIALEMVRKHHEQFSDRTLAEPFEIISTMLLTPTIQDIAQSSSGKIATPVLSTLPFFPTLLQIGSSALTSILPVTWLGGLVTKVTGMKNADALATTVEFLRQPGAVKQALHMARCEMAEIGVSRWKDEIWGVVDAVDLDTSLFRRWTSPKHFFLFAKEDHWIAQSTRDAIEKSMEGRAVIKIDDGNMGLVHAWCLDQSAVVAEIVNKWLVDRD